MSKGIEIADVFRRFLSEYQARFGKVMLPSQRKAVSNIISCMTEAMGGKRFHCNDCSKSFYCYHGCRNRSCPKCHGRQTVDWLKTREAEMLPCEYFHVVATVPSDLRPLFLKEQKSMYGLLMKTIAGALCEIAEDPHYIGAKPGILSVLHTWTAKMHHHPHVHMLVTGGGVSEDGQHWREAKGGYLVPVKKLSKLISRQFAEGLEKERPELFAQVSAKTWKKEWCSFSKHFGRGRDAVLQYLARYVFRIAVTSSRIEAVTESHVTFRYKDNSTGEWKRETITGVDFMRRFLLHVLPKGFHKVRYYGLWSPGKRKIQAMAGIMLKMTQMNEPEVKVLKLADLVEEALAISQIEAHGFVPKCPNCKSENVTEKEKIRRKRWRKMFSAG